MDIRKNRPENLAILITSKSQKASAILADAFLFYSFFVTLSHSSYSGNAGASINAQSSWHLPQ